MRKLLLFLLVFIALPVLAQNGKKVYADFHGVRYTREHDGKLGRWEMYANTEKSSTGRKSLCYNADLINSEGRHEIAAVAYPQVGMQSNLDPDSVPSGGRNERQPYWVCGRNREEDRAAETGTDGYV